MKSQRLIWADSIKGWLIILVVLGHAIQITLGAECDSNHLWNLIYSFHMPAFMAISGYLAYRSIDHKYYLNNYKIILIRRFQQLIVPFLIWTVILLLFNSSLSLETINTYLLYPDKGLWFLWVLFAINCLFLLGSCVAEITGIKQEFLILFFCMVLIAVMIIFEPRVLGFQFIAYYFLFYSIGFFSHKYKKTLFTHNAYILSVLTLFWFVLAWFWKMHDIPSWLHFERIPSSLIQYIYRFATALIAIYLILSISPLILNKDKSLNKFIKSLGTVSLGIYTTHFVIIGRIVKLCYSISANTHIIIACSFVVSLLLSWLIVWLLNRWSFTARFLLGKI